jgi:hypothetical protein
LLTLSGKRTRSMTQLAPVFRSKHAPHSPASEMGRVTWDARRPPIIPAKTLQSLGGVARGGALSSTGDGNSEQHGRSSFER